MNTKPILILVFVAILTGCSAFGGRDTFDCPNTEVGAACISARQVYAATHVADTVPPGYIDGKRIDSKKSSDSGSKEVLNGLNTVQPPLPQIDTPLPIRTQAKVMRIRIFPWEDNSRDLNTGGFVYTEIEGRTWNIGEEQVSRVQANVISPLQMPLNGRMFDQNTSPLSMPNRTSGSKPSN